MYKHIDGRDITTFLKEERFGIYQKFDIRMLLNKEIEDEIILSRASSLKERGLLKKFSHSAGDIVVPGLTNLV